MRTAPCSRSHAHAAHSYVARVYICKDSDESSMAAIMREESQDDELGRLNPSPRTGARCHTSLIFDQYDSSVEHPAVECEQNHAPKGRTWGS